jgi:hypothetical protein
MQNAEGRLHFSTFQREVIVLLTGAEEDSTFPLTSPEDFQLDCWCAAECSWTLKGRRWAVQASALRTTKVKVVVLG